MRYLGYRVGYLILSLALGAGCRGMNAAEFEDAAPEEAAFAMEVTGDSASEGLTTSSDADWGESAQALSAPGPEYLQHTRGAIRALNEAVARILRPIGEAIAAGKIRGAKVGDARTYGPHDKGGATYTFTIKKIANKLWGWRLDAKPQGAADTAYVQVMGGLFHEGELPRRGRGAMGVDLDKLATVDASFKGAGQMLVGFAHVAGFKVLAYGLKGFSPDVTAHDPVDAVFSGWRGPLGGTRVRLALHANVEDSPTAAKELVLLRARWFPGEGGRADAIAVKGDVPDGRAIVANSCWNKSLEAGVSGFLLVRDCPIGELRTGCTVIRTEGALVNCARSVADEELPPTAPVDPTLEPGAPMTEPIPGAFPTGE